MLCSTISNGGDREMNFTANRGILRPNPRSHFPALAEVCFAVLHGKLRNRRRIITALQPGR